MADASQTAVLGAVARRSGPAERVADDPRAVAVQVSPQRIEDLWAAAGDPCGAAARCVHRLEQRQTRPDLLDPVPQLAVDRLGIAESLVGQEATTRQLGAHRRPVEVLECKNHKPPCCETGAKQAVYVAHAAQAVRVNDHRQLVGDRGRGRPLMVGQCDCPAKQVQNDLEGGRKQSARNSRGEVPGTAREPLEHSQASGCAASLAPRRRETGQHPRRSGERGGNCR